MGNFLEIETSPEVVAVLFAKHGGRLKPFASYSNPTGDCPLGNGDPQMETWYGIDGGSEPLIHINNTWKRGQEDCNRVDEKTERWLCYPVED